MLYEIKDTRIEIESKWFKSESISKKTHRLLNGLSGLKQQKQAKFPLLYISRS